MADGMTKNIFKAFSMYRDDIAIVEESPSIQQHITVGEIMHMFIYATRAVDTSDMMEAYEHATDMTKRYFDYKKWLTKKEKE